MAKVLVTGGTGLIGQHLCRILLARGHDVGVLSRQRESNDGPLSTYYWDLDKGEIDKEAINTSDFIIHLAGVNIGSKRWTVRRKKEILESRTKSVEIILHNLDNHNNLKAFISSSAIGYYGAKSSEQIFVETDPPGADFIGEICSKWEQGAEMFGKNEIRVVKIRTGIVLSDKGGALSRFIPLARIGLGSAIGSGKQFMPWIHIEDLVGIYLAAIDNIRMVGSYNAIAPEHITNKDFARSISKILRRPFWFPNVPKAMLSLLYGEMSEMILNGSRVSSKKIEDEGFQFQYKTLHAALESILKE